MSARNPGIYSVNVRPYTPPKINLQKSPARGIIAVQISTEEDIAMLLAIDVGNTNIVLGCIEGETIRFTARLATERTRTEDEYALLLANILALRGVGTKEVDGAIVSSVVPELRPVFQRSVQMLCGVTPLVVGAGVKSGLDIKIDNPAQLGSDLVVGAVGAIAQYEKPLLVFDFGTATTLSVIDGKGRYRGGMIIPGLRLAVEALSSGTAQLPHVDLSAPDHVIGTNTIDCMNSGAIYGTAAMLDGVIQRVEEELGEEIRTVVGTGGLVDKVAPYCRRRIEIDDALMLRGLKIIYEKNKK